MALTGKVGAVQGLVALVGAAIAGMIGGVEAAVAAAYGGFVAVVPTLYFGWRVRMRKQDATPRQVLGVFVRAEWVKLALTVLLFAGGAALFGRQFLPLILTCAACLAVYAVALAARW